MKPAQTQNMLMCLLLTLGITNLGEAAKAATCNVQPNTDPAYPYESITGTVSFYQPDDASVNQIFISLSGFNTSHADKLHGFHVHEKGNLTGGCAATGGHYNPNNVEHGAPNETTRHVGDLGNIEANAQGKVAANITDYMAKLFGTQSIIGKAIVIHEGEDDLGLGGQPGSKTTGNAGGRLACCIITETSIDTGTAPSANPAASLFISAALLILLCLWT